MPVLYLNKLYHHSKPRSYLEHLYLPHSPYSIQYQGMSLLSLVDFCRSHHLNILPSFSLFKTAPHSLRSTFSFGFSLFLSLLSDALPCSYFALRCRDLSDLYYLVHIIINKTFLVLSFSLYSSSHSCSYLPHLGCHSNMFEIRPWIYIFE